MSDSSSRRWFPLRRGGAPRLRLFCLPYAGGSAVVYRNWANLLPPDIEVCAVELPGRGSRFAEPLLESAEAILSGLLDPLRPLLDVPFAIFGHSMGALLAFELTRALRSLGGPQPRRLFVSGRHAAHLPARGEKMHDLSNPELIRRLRQLDGTSEQVLGNPALLDLLLPVVRADFTVCEAYRFTDGQPPFELPLSAFGGVADAEVWREDLEAWSAHTRGPFSLRMFPGGHFFLATAEAAVLRAIATDLMSDP